MGSLGRSMGMAVAITMFLFSLWMYQRSGDWVALVFAIGSLGYGVFFFTRRGAGE
ncbi:hypothetical protein [Halioglobus maricola]|uniref:hypothetical protein n=1 Tax=Halioglobus maricola TaxID=2601894 RepID=UPI001292E9DF|nr:hypothetical protein [Halioglobus maricola]